MNVANTFTLTASYSTFVCGSGPVPYTALLRASLSQSL